MNYHSLIGSLLFLNLSAAQAQSFDPAMARRNYYLAVSNESVCKHMIAELHGKQDDPLALGYLGAYQAVWASHLWNLFEKLSSFRRGRTNIEKAIARNPGEVELHFIRLSVQQHLPRILGYRSDIASDKRMVVENFKTLHSGELKKMIIDFFNDTHLLTQQEKLELE